MADCKALRNKAASMQVAATFGIRSYTELLVLHGDVLLIPRLDRRVEAGRVRRLHQKSMASLLGLSGFDLPPSLFERVAGNRCVASDPAAGILEFIKRDVLNLATRNTAMQVLDGRVQLSPLFGFAPMYLDPDMISRTLRWYRPGSRKELVSWRDIQHRPLKALPMGEY